MEPTLRACGRAALLGVALVVGAAGCDAQADSTYPGEPLATIHGTVTRSLPGPAPDVTMAFVSANPFGGSDAPMLSGYLVKVAVTGSFPAQFKIQFYQPPGLGPVVIGQLEAIWSDSPQTVVNPADCILGYTNYYVFYFSQDVPASLPWYMIFQDLPDAGPVGIPDAGRPGGMDQNPTVGEYFGGSIHKGFHLFTRRGVVDGRATGFDEVPTGLNTDLQVEINGTVGPDCRVPRQYPYDGGVP